MADGQFWCGRCVKTSDLPPFAASSLENAMTWHRVFQCEAARG